MSGGNEVARNLLAQEPGRRNRHANAADTQQITPKLTKRHRGGTPYRITPSAGNEFRIVVSGRLRWALDRLRAAGERGCTPIDNPAPRWSAYVYSLRELGVEIETVHERHTGPFPGTHARYVLKARVTRSDGQEAA